MFYLVVKTSTQALILTAAEGEKHARVFFPSGTGFVLGPSDYARLFVACGPIGATFAVDRITYYTQPEHSKEGE